MKLDIVIPTRNRVNKLNICLNSIKDAIKEIPDVRTKISVYFDRYEDSISISILHPEINICVIDEEYKAPRFWNSYLKTMNADTLCYLNDDIKLDKNCLKEGLKELDSLNNNGVVGFYQSNQIGKGNCNAAFGLIGNTFANRFPDRKVFCEDYYCLYLDEELMKYASSINRFIGSKTATLEHYHPVFTKEKPDETHIHNRRYKQRDIKIYNIRKERDLIWGKSFERITKE